MVSIDSLLPSGTTVHQSDTTKKRIQVFLTAAKVKTSCVEMMANDAVSYRFFEQAGFKGLTDGIQHELNLCINRKSVVTWVQEAADCIRFRIAKLLKKRLFNIIVDAASRFGRSVLCITAQFVDAGKIELFCLGMKEMNVRHTAHNIAEEIKSVLALYNLDILQVYSVSSDNASNMISAVRVLTEQQKEEIRDMLSLRSELDTELDDQLDYFNAGYGKFKLIL